jgi:signal transduction histidine kinase
MRRFLPVEQALLGGARWLIRLRWAAVVAAAFAVTIGVTVFHLPLPVRPLTVIIGWVAAYNLLFTLLHGRLHVRTTLSGRGDQPAYRLFNAQIALDWTALAALIHYSGGVDNPFLVAFVFHAILASILLPRAHGFMHVSLPILLVVAMGIAENRGWIAHIVCFGAEGPDSPQLLAVKLVAFAVAMYTVVYLTTEIAAILRRREEEMLRLEESLQQANEALLATDRIRSEYVLRVSHDLQSPLSAAYSMLDLVGTTMAGTMSAKGRDFLRRSLARLGTLMRFVRELHEISLLRAARPIASDPVDLREVAKAAAEEVLAKEHEHRIDLAIDLPTGLPLVAGDGMLLAAGLAELIGNAAKYASGDVRIAVRARPSEGKIELDVEDTGSGIPEEEISRIFDEFYRGSAAKRLVPDGTGLGLALVKLIVERHRGAIRVTSRPGQGSCFTITLPVSEEASEKTSGETSGDTPRQTA